MSLRSMEFRTKALSQHPQEEWMLEARDKVGSQTITKHHVSFAYFTDILLHIFLDYEVKTVNFGSHFLGLEFPIYIS